MDLQTFLDDFMGCNNLQLLVRDVCELFQCPVMVVDMAFRAVAWHSPPDFSDEPYQGSIERGRLTYETSSFLINGENSEHTVTLEDSPYRRRFSTLSAGDVVIGYLILVDIHNRLEDTDPHLFASVEAALAKQLLLETNRESAVQNTDEAVLITLLEGKYSDEGLLRLQMDATGLKLFHPQHLVMVNLDLYQSTKWSDNALQNEILGIFPDSHPLLYDGSLLFFISSSPDMARFKAFAWKYHLRVLVSRRLKSIVDLSEVHLCLSQIMHYIQPRTAQPFVAREEEFFNLMFLLSLRDAGGKAMPRVQTISEKDREDGSQWCLTLYTYLSCGRSLRETSERLFTHRNTILYRIRKLKEDYDIPLNDPNLMMSLLVSSGLALLEQGCDAPFLPALDPEEPDA